ncbi:MAG: arginine--tRNA ligase [Candidatus Tagabacteria bacterium]
MIREILQQEIEKAVEKLYGKKIDFNVSADGVHADYSSNAAMVIGGNSRKVAEEIKNELLSFSPPKAGPRLTDGQAPLAEKIEIAGPGFLNFWLSEDGLSKELANISGSGYLLNWKKEKREKISLDYLDVNPTGPIHLGNARSGFYGDVLSNILEFYGYKISREFYVNNAKSSGQIQSLGKTALGQGDEYKHEQLLNILKKPEVKNKLKTFKDVKEAGFYIAGLIQKENEKFLKSAAKIKFDLFFEEEKIYSSGMIKKILEMLKKANAIYEKDGAVWLKSSKLGDSEDRVLIRKTGEPTYLLPDIGYHLDRLVSRKYNKAINIFGADHYGYGPRLKAALKIIGIDPKGVEILIYQMIRLIRQGQEVKMSKRKGEFVSLEELIDEVGLDATRFFFLMRSLDTHMDFDLDLAKEQSKKNPVYYVQYAHARACSILRKAGPSEKKSDFSSIGLAVGSLSENKIKAREEKSDFFSRNLILKLIQFPEIIEEIAKDYQVHRLTTYVYELAKVFTDFYENVRVLKAESEELKKFRLALVSITKNILEKSLSLMGIFAPDKM